MATKLRSDFVTVPMTVSQVLASQQREVHKREEFEMDIAAENEGKAIRRSNSFRPHNFSKREARVRGSFFRPIQLAAV